MCGKPLANAADDSQERKWVEAKVRAEETLTATRRTMAEYDSELDPDYRQQLHAALDEVEAVLSLENPKTRTGDPARLKAATAQLDEVTKPLAEYAMDKVMEAMLRKKGVL